MKKLSTYAAFNRVKAARSGIALATLALSLGGCVYEPVPMAPPPPPVAVAPAPGYCCYAYPQYPPGYYGYGGPAVSFGYYGGGRGYGHWR